MVKPLSIGVVTLSMLLCISEAKSSYASQQEVESKGNFYVGFGYGPVISKVDNFTMGVDRETRWIFQHNAASPNYLRHSENFYWNAEYYPDFVFNKYSSGFKGSAGYGMGGLRIELEASRAESEILESGIQKKVKGGGIPFVLGKEVTANAAKKDYVLQKAMAQYGLKELFKIQGYVRQIGITANDADTQAVYTAVRRTINHISNGGGILAMFLKKAYLKAIALANLNNAVNNMSPERKMIFIRSIAMGVEGADMIEIDAIRSTSVIANLCYDFSQINFVSRVSPYACGGIGSSVVSMTDGYSDVQFSYKFKLGLNYSFRKNYIAYIGASYHKVVGEEYNNVPLLRLLDDTRSANEPAAQAGVKFGLSYVDFEIGSRIIF